MFLRPLHRDRKIAALLRLWDSPYSSVEARTCRRLFHDMSEMEEFFQLAFPQAGSVADSSAKGYIAEGEADEVDVIRTLELLDKLDAPKDFVHPMAYLADMQNRGLRTDRSYQLFRSGGDEQVGMDFLRAFKNVHPATLRHTLRHTFWQNVAAAQWVVEAARLGVPDGYLQDLAVGPLVHGHGYNPWTPQQIADMYAEGMTVAYLERFWKLPAVLAEMWEHRIPLDYAIALDESTRTD